MLAKKRSFIRLIVFLTGLFLFLNSCGLDTYVVVDAPLDPGFKPNTDSLYTNMYFEFETNSNSSHYPSDFVFLGTNVYYKIYSNISELQKHTSDLNNWSNNFETSVKARVELIDTYTYQPLQIKNYPIESALVPANDVTHQLVYIRLTDYYNIPSEVTLDGSPLYGSLNTTIPVRNVGDYTFNFGRTGTFDKKPQIGDADVWGTSAPSDGIWYVAMYAVAFGRTVTFEQQYSNIVYLGAVSINSNVENN